MRQIFKITKAELQVLFYSPIAWLMLALFMLQSTMTYFYAVDSLADSMEFTGIVRDATYRLLVKDGMSTSININILGTVFLFIPLLTMGFISRELSSGSIKLLFSSPISNFQIVMGKFFAIAVYAFVMCLWCCWYIYVKPYIISNGCSNWYICYIIFV